MLLLYSTSGLLQKLSFPCFMRTYVRKKIRRRERERAAWLLWHFVKNTRAYVGGPKDLRGNAYEIPARDAYLLPQSHTPKLNAIRVH